MVDAPEKIWAASVTENYGEWQTTTDGLPRPTEYTRSDLVAELVAENERLAGARVKVKLLEWSEIRPPNEEVRYDHVVSASALGQWSIEWKSWKEYDDRTIFLDGDFVANGGENLEAAKSAAQADYERRILSALAEPAGEVEPSKWSIPGSTYAGATTPPASAIREAEKIDPVELVQQKIQKLSNGKDAAEYVIATMVTNLKTGKVTVDQLLEWFDVEGRAALAGRT